MDGFDLEFTWIIILMVYIDNLNWGFTQIISIHVTCFALLWKHEG